MEDEESNDDLNYIERTLFKSPCLILLTIFILMILLLLTAYGILK